MAAASPVHRWGAKPWTCSFRVTCSSLDLYGIGFFNFRWFVARRVNRETDTEAFRPDENANTVWHSMGIASCKKKQRSQGTVERLGVVFEAEESTLIVSLQML